ncbi:MAG: hypothetical protein ABSG84_17965 [Acidobacteriaceae bacterium]|jgi:hypothetical protein
MTEPHPHHVDPSTEQSLSIWFFVGVLMLGCGLIILGQGIYEFSHPATAVLAATDVAANVLASLHPAFWWGIVMTLFGAFYTIHFRPGKG